jgi:hypothetical protein
MLTGFVQSRRGLLEHLSDGRVSPLEYAAFSVIRDGADPSSGIWHGGSRGLSVIFGQAISERTARRLLESLESKGYIKRFPVPGRHANYGIAVNKYECTVGARSGMRLSIDGANVIADLHYSGGEETGEHTGEETGEHMTPFKEEKENNKKTKPRTATKPADAPPAFSGQVLKITGRQDRAFGEAFPCLDLQAEYRKADAWLMAHTERRIKRLSQFMYQWLGKCPAPWFSKRRQPGEGEWI